MNKERWTGLMQALGLPLSEPTYAQLINAYREPHRHYHTTRHIEDCLSKLDLLRTRASRPEEVELAIWFHDAIYEPYKSRNEEKSAEWAARFLGEGGASESLIVRVRDLIMATRHEAVATDRDCAILIDVDLSILGSDAWHFLQFEQQVRSEYRWVPGVIYRRARRKVLGQFLARGRIFTTDEFFSRYEAQARVNIEGAIRSLGGPRRAI